MAGAARQDEAADGRVATPTGLAGALIDAEHFFEAAHIAVGIAEITESRSAISNCAPQQRADRPAKFIPLGGTDAGGRAGGVNARGEEGFVGVDVAQAGDAGLIEKEGFDNSLFIK